MEVIPLTVVDQHPTTSFGANVEMGPSVGVVIRFIAAPNRNNFPYSTGRELLHFVMVNVVIVYPAICA